MSLSVPNVGKICYAIRQSMAKYAGLIAGHDTRDIHDALEEYYGRGQRALAGVRFAVSSDDGRLSRSAFPRAGCG